MKWKVTLLSVLSVFFIQSVKAQISPETYPLLKVSNVALEDTVAFIFDILPDSEEKVAGNIDIGFTFTYSGSSFSKISVSSGGAVGLGEQIIEIGSILKSNFKSSSNPFILAPLLSNHATSEKGYVGHFYSGTRGNGVCVIEWKVRLINDESSPYARFQVLLYENDNRIEFRYGENILPQESGVLVGLSDSKTFMTVMTETATPIYNEIYKNEFAQIPLGTAYRFYGIQPKLTSTKSDSLRANAAQVKVMVTSNGMIPDDFLLYQSPSFKFEKPILLNPEAFASRAPFQFATDIREIPFSRPSFFFFEAATSKEYQAKSPIALIHSPVPTSDLAAYYKPSLGLVSNSVRENYFWYDLSGNGLNASIDEIEEGLTFNRIMNRANEGKLLNTEGQLIDFTESRFPFRAPANIQVNPKEGLTLFAVVAEDFNFLNSRSIFFGMANSSATVDFGREASSKKFFAQLSNAALDVPEQATHTSESFEFISREASIVAFRYSEEEKGSTAELFANGIQYLNEPTIKLSDAPYTNVFITRGSNSLFKGLLGDVILHSRALTDLEMASVFFHLAREYGNWRVSAKSIQVDSSLGLFNFPDIGINLLITKSSNENRGLIEAERLNTVPINPSSIKGKAYANGVEIEPKQIYPELAWKMNVTSNRALRATYGISLNASLISNVASPERLLIMVFDTTEKVWKPVNTIRSAGYISATGLTEFGTYAIGDDSEPALSLPRNSGRIENFVLEQNYPNPFNPSTTIRYQLNSAENVSLKVYDVLGREVVNLVNTRQASGRYEVTFNASGISSGVYFYRLSAGSQSAVKKMLLLK